MRHLSVLLVSALGLLIVGCKNDPLPNNLGNHGFNNPPIPTNNLTPPNNLQNNLQNNNIPSPPMNQTTGSGIAGTWRPDTNTLAMSLPTGQAPPQEQLEQMVGQIKQQLGAMSVTFNADGTYTSTNGQMNSGGHYSVQGQSIQMQDNNPQSGPLPQVTMGQNGGLHMHADFGQVTLDIDLVRG